MNERNFQRIETQGITLRCVVEGTGPLVFLLHGFPQCWYLWRHQIEPLVAAGYRVVVPDQRGYGESDCPPEIADYNIRALSGDIAGLATALGEDEFVVVGHDWGCIVAWNTALLHEERCKAVLGLSVPYNRGMAAFVDPPGMDDRFWYIRYFQEPGVAEAELEDDLERSLLSVYYTVSADAGENDFMGQLAHSRDSRLLDTMRTPEKLPSWLSQHDLDYYVEQYQTSGFRGPINWYRNIPTNDGLTPELDNKKFSQPAAFIAGAKDEVLRFAPNWRDTMPRWFDDLRFIELIDDAGHWVQMEKPAETNAAILRFLQGL